MTIWNSRKLMNNNKTFYVWSSDFEEFTGEGILARNFLTNIFKKHNGKVNIKSNNAQYIYFKKKLTKIKSSNYKNNFVNKYLKIFIGISYLIKHNLKGYKTLYINYLPLWNFLIFFLLPKKTYLGPITGGTYILDKKKLGGFVRKYLFPIFFRLSNIIIEKKIKLPIFSTTMLTKYLRKSIVKRSNFNLNLICFSPQKKNNNKDIDYLFYYRIHSNKSNIFLFNLINKLAQDKNKIYVVGDKFPNKNVKNLGNLKRKVLLNYLSRTRFSLNSGENFYSLFALDCISNHVHLFIDKKSYIKKNYFPNNSICIINFNKFTQSCEKIKKIKKTKNYFLYNFTSLKDKKKNLSNCLRKIYNF
jgi:hypothetical protein